MKSFYDNLLGMDSFLEMDNSPSEENQTTKYFFSEKEILSSVDFISYPGSILGVREFTPSCISYTLRLKT